MLYLVLECMSFNNSSSDFVKSRTKLYLVNKGLGEEVKLLSTKSSLRGFEEPVAISLCIDCFASLVMTFGSTLIKAQLFSLPIFFNASANCLLGTGPLGK